MRKLAALAACTAGMAALPAHAQDTDKSVEAFAGPIIGYDTVKLDDGVVSIDDDGVMYGFVGGVDYQFNNSFFGGVEAEYADSDTGDAATDVLAPGDKLSLLADRQIYVGARIGMRLADNSKVYLKGGYVSAKIKGIYDDGVDSVSDSVDVSGFLLGAGADFRITRNLMLRGEYRYSEYNNIEVAGYNTGIDATRHQVVGGVLYGF